TVEQERAALLAARHQAEEELGRLREQVRRRPAEEKSSDHEDDGAAQRVAGAWRAEVEAVVAMHLAAQARLAEELTGHREALEATRTAHEQLQSAVAAKAGSEAALRQELAR